MSINKTSEKKASKSKVPTKEYALIKPTSISGVLRPVGYKVKLSVNGALDFRSKNRIK